MILNWTRLLRDGSCRMAFASFIICWVCKGASSNLVADGATDLTGRLTTPYSHGRVYWQRRLQGSNGGFSVDGGDERLPMASDLWVVLQWSVVYGDARLRRQRQKVPAEPFFCLDLSPLIWVFIYPATRVTYWQQWLVLRCLWWLCATIALLRRQCFGQFSGKGEALQRLISVRICS